MQAVSRRSSAPFGAPAAYRSSQTMPSQLNVKKYVHQTKPYVPTDEDATRTDKQKASVQKQFSAVISQSSTRSTVVNSSIVSNKPQLQLPERCFDAHVSSMVTPSTRSASPTELQQTQQGVRKQTKRDTEVSSCDVSIEQEQLRHINARSQNTFTFNDLPTHTPTVQRNGVVRGVDGVPLPIIRAYSEDMMSVSTMICNPQLVYEANAKARPYLDRVKKSIQWQQDTVRELSTSLPAVSAPIHGRRTTSTATHTTTAGRSSAVATAKDTAAAYGRSNTTAVHHTQQQYNPPTMTSFSSRNATKHTAPHAPAPSGLAVTGARSLGTNTSGFGSSSSGSSGTRGSAKSPRAKQSKQGGWMKWFVCGGYVSEDN